MIASYHTSLSEELEVDTLVDAACGGSTCVAGTEVGRQGWDGGVSDCQQLEVIPKCEGLFGINDCKTEE